LRFGLSPAQAASCFSRWFSIDWPAQ